MEEFNRKNYTSWVLNIILVLYYIGYSLMRDLAGWSWPHHIDAETLFLLRNGHVRLDDAYTFGVSVPTFMGLHKM